MLRGKYGNVKRHLPKVSKGKYGNIKRYIPISQCLPSGYNFTSVGQAQL